MKLFKALSVFTGCLLLVFGEGTMQKSDLIGYLPLFLGALLIAKTADTGAALSAKGLLFALFARMFLQVSGLLFLPLTWVSFAFWGLALGAGLFSGLTFVLLSFFSPKRMLFGRLFAVFRAICLLPAWLFSQQAGKALWQGMAMVFGIAFLVCYGKTIRKPRPIRLHKASRL